MGLRDLLARLTGSGRTKPLRPAYVHRRPSDGVAGFIASGPQPAVTGVLFSMLTDFQGSMGIVLVEHRDRSREWMARDLKRPHVAEALMGIRDLLGNGLMDLAVFSGAHALEVFLDRWGTLEIRTGSWNEPKIIAVFEAAGFEPADHVPTVPPGAHRDHEWSREATDRARSIREHLGLEPAPEPEDAEDSGARSDG